MIDLKQLQREVYQNKVEKGFNITRHLQGILLSAGRAGRGLLKLMTGSEPGLGEELADVAIYLLGLAEIRMWIWKVKLCAKLKLTRKRKYVYGKRRAEKRRRVDRGAFQQRLSWKVPGE